MCSKRVSHSSLADFSADYFPKRQQSRTVSGSWWLFFLQVARSHNWRNSGLQRERAHQLRIDFLLFLSIHNFFLTQQIIKKQSHLNTNPSSVYYFGCPWSWLSSEKVFLPGSPTQMVWFRRSLDGGRRPCTCICHLAVSRFTWPSDDNSKREKGRYKSSWCPNSYCTSTTPYWCKQVLVFQPKPKLFGKQVRERQRIVHILVHQKCLQI